MLISFLTPLIYEGGKECSAYGKKQAERIAALRFSVSKKPKKKHVIANQSADWCGDPVKRSENPRKLGKIVTGLPRRPLASSQ